MSHVAAPSFSFSQEPSVEDVEATRRYHRKLMAFSALGCVAIIAFKIFVVLNLSM